MKSINRREPQRAEVALPDELRALLFHHHRSTTRRWEAINVVRRVIQDMIDDGCSEREINAYIKLEILELEREIANQNDIEREQRVQKASIDMALKRQGTAIAAIAPALILALKILTDLFRMK